MKKYMLILLGFFLLMENTHGQKQKITSADQLPRRTVALEGKVADIFHQDELLNQLALEIYQNLLRDLDQFDIEDKATLISYQSTLIQFEFYLGKYDSIPSRLEKIRALEEREEDKLVTGLTAYSQLKALKNHPLNSESYFKDFKENYTHALNQIPYEKIEQFVNNTINRYSMLNTDIILPSLETQLQPFLDNGNGQVLEQIAAAIILNKSAMNYNFTLKDPILQALNTYKEANSESLAKKEKVNIWEDRAINLSAGKGNPVVIAIWDTGFDTSLFPDQLWTNPKETIDGKDEDQNGYIDDRHGIAFDTENRRTKGDLIPPQNLSHSQDQLLAWTKGSMDLQHGIFSEEAKAFQQKAATLKPEEAKAFQEDLGWFGVYSHGTHVAGIAAAGNPMAKLLNTRISYETTSVPSPPTEERHENSKKMYAEMVEYWKQAGVRVVNISLRFNPGMFEGLLNMHGIGKNQEERKATALRWFNAEKKALEAAMASAPEILFICAAGNEANDADFANYYPASLVLPNLLTIGAVDAEGKKTNFTTEGKNITLFANGYEIESYVPGGARVNFNGTSMASPQVANLAAKMLVVNPDLSPEQLKKIMYETATVSEEDSKIKLIHPKKAVAAAAEMAGLLSSDFSQD